jgi:thiamine transporter 2/3
MNDWFKISLLLSIFGFLKEIRPSEPFIYEFLVGPWRNITADDVTEQVFPVGTYSYLAQSIVVFLITDLCRCFMALLWPLRWHITHTYTPKSPKTTTSR